jgi:DNA repair protein RecO (recombination protein O)
MAGGERVFRLQAVVLRHQDWGEADRLITLYSLEKGKLKAIAKGARKLRSRKAGHLEPFSRLSLLLAQGRDLPLITQAETLDPLLPLREDLRLLGYASYVVELLERFSVEEEQNVPSYQLLVDTLGRLAQGEEAGFELRYFELRLLDQAGFRPQLFRCVGCGEEIQAQDQFFSLELGGAVCPQCGSKGGDVVRVSMPALKYLRHFQRSSYAEARKAQIPPLTLMEMEDLLHRYLTYLLERKLNSPKFIRTIAQLRKDE